LAELFAEFKQDLESTASNADDDPETHYNLGIAFKEMGLMDEAIGELQKVCQAIDRGVEFSQTVEAYTWLAQCFLETGVPEAGIKWYEKALQLRGLGSDSTLALHYELGCAHEAAGHSADARRHFMQVLSTNIDYRDVAERIKSLKS
jgi:tetratricopeptide (TPR) repeat protein